MKSIAFLLLVVSSANARHWSEIVVVDNDMIVDSHYQHYLVRTDPFWVETFTSFPTMRPSRSQSLVAPSITPSLMPSSEPSITPSITPSTEPTIAPSTEPTQTPPIYYFNYDASSPYGPEQWARVATPNYWNEFTRDDGFGPWQGKLNRYHPMKLNLCHTGHEQSPIDLRENRKGCDETHQVRSKPGDYTVPGEDVTPEIHSNKLRLIFARRPCADLSNVTCQEPDPPHADFPNGWRSTADATHLDVKIPAEHLLYSQVFDAEMQVFHLHAGRQRMATQSVLIRATEHGYNSYFQHLLDAFQEEYIKNQLLCDDDSNRRRRMTKIHRWPHKKSWDPQHPMLVPSIHFFRYDGSLTEPPCSEFVTWFVCTEPMMIGLEQLEQMKTILFTNLDKQCRKSSVDFEHSVARPIRPIGNRTVAKCTEKDFGPDPW